jgi:N6-adenosine-specific RNA methylase IME4
VTDRLLEGSGDSEAAKITRLENPHPFAGLYRNHYRCVLIDPPTRFVAGTKGRPLHYERQTDREIAAMPVADLVHPDGAFLFLCVTSAKLFRQMGSKTQLRPDEIAHCWGFRWSARAFVWIKTQRRLGRLSAKPLFINPVDDVFSGTGLTTRKNCEDVLLFHVGNPKRLSKGIREPIFAPVREHSRKPDELFERIEQFCAGPYLELYSRQPRIGWDTWGREREKFADAG